MLVQSVRLCHPFLIVTDFCFLTISPSFRDFRDFRPLSLAHSPMLQASGEIEAAGQERRQLPVLWWLPEVTKRMSLILPDYTRFTNPEYWMYWVVLPKIAVIEISVEMVPTSL